MTVFDMGKNLKQGETLVRTIADEWSLRIGGVEPLKRCKTCRHWDVEECEWLGNRQCTAGKGWFVGGGDNNDSLYTEPEFGCVNWEAKETER